jgi:hypothetical protein
MTSSSVVIDDFDLIGVALPELEANAPWAVDSHCPLPIPIALQLMQADTFEGTEIMQRFGDIQGQQQIDGRIVIKTSQLICG